jgi:UDP-glucose 4-epimerase
MILVTGATGYIGRHLIPKLLESGFSVFPLGRDLSVLDKIERPEIVIHLAGKINISLKQNPEGANLPPVIDNEDFWSLYESNVNLTGKILEYCSKNLKIKHLIFASTQAVYGMPEAETITEESVCHPLEYYGLTKLFAENLLKIGELEGLPVSILRIPGIYGGDKKKGAVYSFCKSAIEDGLININIDYPLPFDCIHIDDVTDAITKCASYYPQNGKTRFFNIATGELCSLDLLAHLISDIVSDCQIISSGVLQPTIRMQSQKAVMHFGWKAIERKERLSQLCRDIRNQT